MKRDSGSSATLLHNMSVAPRTVITYKSGSRRAYGMGRVFSMPEFDGLLDPMKIVGLLDQAPAANQPGPAVSLTAGEAEDQLRARINAHARTLPLPPAAAVVDSCFEEDDVSADLLSVVTVLAKSSSHVYLRDKEPNLAAIRPGRRVIVLLPPNWSMP